LEIDFFNDRVSLWIDTCDNRSDEKCETARTDL